MGENFKIRGYYDENGLAVLLKDEIKCRNVHFFNRIVKKICAYLFLLKGRSLLSFFQKFKKKKKNERSLTKWKI